MPSCAQKNGKILGLVFFVTENASWGYSLHAGARYIGK